MRLPRGAPVPLGMRVRQKLPLLKRLSSVSLGTWAVVSCVALTALGFFAVGVYPKLNHEFYAQTQREKRALIKASREELAHGQNVWTDPFGKK